MKILFLDVDGVLNTRPGSLDDDKLNRLSEIVKVTDCRLVLSSSWREVPEMRKRLIRALWHRGLHLHSQTLTLQGVTHAWGFVSQVPRHVEIRKWLNDAQLDPIQPRITSYCILDDIDYADDGSGRFVRTDATRGLTESDARLVIEILNTPL